VLIRGHRPSAISHKNMADPAITALSTCYVMVLLTQAHKYSHTFKPKQVHILIYVSDGEMVKNG